MSSAGSGCEPWSFCHLSECCRIIQPGTQRLYHFNQQQGKLENCQFNRIDHLYGEASGLIYTSGVGELHSMGGKVVHGCHGDMPRVRPWDKKSVTA